MTNSLISWYRRQRRNPFRDGQTRPLIVHCSHHKVGTAWFAKVLRGIADPYGLHYYSGTQDQLPASADIFMENHSRLDKERLPHFRGSHLIRDPRDVVVSAYFYHVWTKEAWAHVPMRELPEQARERWKLVEPDRHGDLSYQQYLNSLDQEEGIAAEMKRITGTFLAELLEWDYNDPRFMELKYENLMADEQAGFRALFEHYGFNDEAIERGLQIVDAESFSKRSGRNLGEVEGKSHMRSGKSGQWRETYTQEHIALCRELFGDALIRLGYEQDLNWQAPSSDGGPTS